MAGPWGFGEESIDVERGLGGRHGQLGASDRPGAFIWGEGKGELLCKKGAGGRPTPAGPRRQRDNTSPKPSSPNNSP